MRRLPTVLGALGGVVLLAGAGAVFGVLPFTAYGPFGLLVVAAGATALGVAVWARRGRPRTVRAPHPRSWPCSGRSSSSRPSAPGRSTPRTSAPPSDEASRGAGVAARRHAVQQRSSRRCSGPS